MPVKILFNGKEENLENEISILELLKKKNIRPEVVTVELNDKIIKREEYGNSSLNNNDRIEIVFFMGGGNSMDERKQKKVGTKIAQNVLDLILNTPMVKLNKIVDSNGAEVYAKLESYSPGGSVKDRIALSMIEDAEEQGRIKQGSVIVEPTSGNTGIGIALICAVKGYRCILTMPESMSLERRCILKSFGAEIILTPATEGMQGAVKKAEEIVRKNKNSCMLQQFENPANPDVHRKTTAQEILTCMNGKVDVFVCGVGTGGTITGVGEVLKKKIPEIRIVAVEPESSAVLSGKTGGPHKIQGIGAGFIPVVLNRDVIDQIIPVKDGDAYNMAGRLAREEGIFCGISSGAACFAALRVAKELDRKKKVVVILPDTGERYFSMQNMI